MDNILTLDQLIAELQRLKSLHENNGDYQVLLLDGDNYAHDVRTVHSEPAYRQIVLGGY